MQNLRAVKKDKQNPGFIAKMKDGSRYFIPITDRMIKDEMFRRLEEEGLKGDELSDKALQRLCNRSKKYLSVDFCNEYVDDVFAGTEWKEWSSDAVRLPDEPISPDILWEDAELSHHNHIELTPSS